MSGDVHPEPGMVNKVYYDQDDKENIVNIYVSAESLRVYDNPWVEGTSPITPGSAEGQHSVTSGNSGRRNHIRLDSVFLGVVGLLLLAGVIFLGVQMNKEKTTWRGEKKQLMADNTNLGKTIEQLIANNTELSRERDDVWRKYCKLRPRKCKNLDWLDYTDKERNWD